MSYLKVPIIARRFTTAVSGPMEVLNIDYEGPFPEDEYGNTPVLTTIDTFTRAAGLYYAVPNLEARHTARRLVRHIGIFGCPSRIVSDRGTHFTAGVIRELMFLLGTDHKLTLAASRQETAAVKNSNKRSQGYLRAMLCIIRRWSGVLPLVQRIIMAESNKVIGVSPAQLLVGNSMQLAIDRGFFLSNLPQEGVLEAEVTLSDWADDMFTAQKALLDTAQRFVTTTKGYLTYGAS